MDYLINAVVAFITHPLLYLGVIALIASRFLKAKYALSSIWAFWLGLVLIWIPLLSSVSSPTHTPKLTSERLSTPSALRQPPESSIVDNTLQPKMTDEERKLHTESLTDWRNRR